jgi:hypothetical protein
MRERARRIGGPLRTPAMEGTHRNSTTPAPTLQSAPRHLIVRKRTIPEEYGAPGSRSYRVTGAYPSRRDLIALAENSPLKFRSVRGCLGPKAFRPAHSDKVLDAASRLRSDGRR